MRTALVAAALLAAPILALPAPASADQDTDPCASPTLVGTPGADELVGTAGPDVIAGLGGDDTLRGLGGDDVLCGGDDADDLDGGDGDDRLYGGADRWVEGSGDEGLPAGEYVGDTLAGGPGDDLLDGGAPTSGSADTVTYAASATGVSVDLARGRATGEGSDVLASRFRTVYGSDRADTLLGTAGNDIVIAGRGADRVRGGAGDDVLLSGGMTRDRDGSVDVVQGDDGADELFGGPGDRLGAGRGADRLHVSHSGVASAGPGDDSVSVRLGGSGSLTVRGDRGRDYVEITDASTAREAGPAALRGRIDLAEGLLRYRLGTRTMRQVLAGVESVALGVRRGSWSMYGTGGPNFFSAYLLSRGVTLSGRGGDDRLMGTPHADVLLGGAGRDTARGAGGRDVFASVEVRER